MSVCKWMTEQGVSKVIKLTSIAQRYSELNVVEDHDCTRPEKTLYIEGEYLKTNPNSKYKLTAFRANKQNFFQTSIRYK